MWHSTTGCPITAVWHSTTAVWHSTIGCSITAVWHSTTGCSITAVWHSTTAVWHSTTGCSITAVWHSTTVAGRTGIEHSPARVTVCVMQTEWCIFLHSGDYGSTDGVCRRDLWGLAVPPYAVYGLNVYIGSTAPCEVPRQRIDLLPLVRPPVNV